MVEPGQNVSETLRKEFTEEALAKLDMTEDKRAQLANRINHLFRNGKDVRIYFFLCLLTFLLDLRITEIRASGWRIMKIRAHASGAF